ncbi:hypothetical protein [Haloglomus litoreum]|uniref:EMC6-like membrane protein n=1 Tax=Haloglomus litoreum TaxID=3034026 RepID=UPI0023E8E392|nr:hypothetical protein [Haloglomus sp. DT116]
MATDTVDRRTAHLRGVTVTTLAALAGIAAAVVSSQLATGATDRTALFVLVGFTFAQFAVLQGIDTAGILQLDVDDFGAKDVLYVVFMTFAFWFVSWGVLLTSGASL